MVSAGLTSCQTVCTLCAGEEGAGRAMGRGARRAACAPCRAQQPHKKEGDPVDGWITTAPQGDPVDTAPQEASQCTSPHHRQDTIV